MKIFLFILLVAEVSCLIAGTEKNPIKKSMQILRHDLSSKEALQYSNIVAKYSKKYKLDPFLVVSIMRQESVINKFPLRTVGNTIEFEEATSRFVSKTEITDFCMMQIHMSNVIAKNLDHSRLLKDPDYCIHEGLKILVHFRYLKASDKYWWTRYNSSIPHKREIYKSQILEHYSKIKRNIENIDHIKFKYTGDLELDLVVLNEKI